MSVQIVQIGKRSWLAGMTWSSYEDAPSKDELREDAERLSASWVSVRLGEAAIQAGFCAPIDTVKSPAKLNSLAAMLADSREQPWLGIFKIEEGVWWYVAVRDGHAILPDGDVIGGEQEIFAARERHSGYTDWNYVEGDLALLSELIGEVEAKPTRIRSLSGPAIPGTPMIAAGVSLAVILAGAGYWWHLHEQQTQESAAAAAMAKVRATMVATPTESPATTQMLASPAPNEWLAACSEIISPMPLSKSGWSLAGVACEANSASIVWVSGDGATVAGKPDGIVSVQGDAVNQIVQLPGLKPHGAGDMIRLSEAKLLIRAWAQAAGFNLMMNETSSAAALPGAPAPTNDAGPAQSAVVLELPVSPFSLDFSSLPGLRLTKINSTETGWHVEGTLYGR